MSFLRYFFTKIDPLPGDGEGVGSIESNRKRIAAVRKRQLMHGSELDLGRRVAAIESQLAEAGLIIETLIELLEERMGLSREEIEERVFKLTTSTTVTIEPVEHITVAPEPVIPVAPVLTVEEEKERFKPRRRWRDARGQL